MAMTGDEEAVGPLELHPNDPLWDLYTTFGSEDEAADVAARLVAEGLVACVNMWPVRSVFRWEGKVQDEVEVAALMKTPASRVQAAMTRLEALHPYDVPCVEALPVGASTAAFAGWVRSSTQP